MRLSLKVNGLSRPLSHLAPGPATRHVMDDRRGHGPDRYFDPGGPEYQDYGGLYIESYPCIYDVFVTCPTIADIQNDI
jgi:hypothetical protein